MLGRKIARSHQEGRPAFGSIFALLRLRQCREHFLDDLDMRGDLHLFLGLQLGDILLEDGLLAIVVAASVGRGVAVVRPLLQDQLLSRTHTTKIYYSQTYFITLINITRIARP